MKHKLLASFIIVNYNSRQYLNRLITSIFVQNNQSFEIIIVDNDSSDNSTNYISKHFPSIKLIKSTNIGYGQGCNLGAKHASGKFLIFLNPDIYFPKDFLSKYIKFYQNKHLEYGNLGCICCRVVDYNENPNNKKYISGGSIDIFGNPHVITDQTKTNDLLIVFGACLFINRKVFNKSLGFNPNIFLYGEEVDLCWRLKLLGYRNLVDNQNYFYHIGGGSKFGDNRPRQIAYMTYGCFIDVVTNYQLLSLILIIPLYFIYLIVLLIFLPILKNFNFEYSKEILYIFKNFFVNYQSIIKFRNKIQNLRKINDLQLFPYISFIPSIITRLHTTN